MEDNHPPGYAPGSYLSDSYRVRTLLGRGGMGEVYLVEHVETGDLRAAKVMRARAGAPIERLRAFHQEALAMLNLGTHPFVVRLYELLELGRDTVLVMEFIAGAQGCTSIQDYIQRTQDYTDRQLGVWAVELCVGMEHALAHGMEAHRDIKPANLLVGMDGLVKIADFGLALAASRVPDAIGNRGDEPMFFQQLMSIDGRSTCGTPGYIAPELMLGGRASPQSDMFSLGVTLWQLADRSMEMPFPVAFAGDIPAYQEALLRSVMAGEIRPLDSPFYPVIRRCLHSEPAKRFDGFPALREAIKSAAKQAGLLAMDFIVKEGFEGEFDDYVNRGRAYLALGRVNRALRILDRAVELDPLSARAIEARAETLYQRGDEAGALKEFKAANQLKPEWDAPIIGIAKTLVELDEFDSAIQHLDRVLAQHPGNLDALVEKSGAEARRGQRDLARALLLKALKADPQHALAHEYLGRMLWVENDLHGAARSLLRSLDINPLNTSARLALAALLTVAEQPEAATQHYLLAQALHHGDSEGLNLVATHMAENGHAKEAIKLFRELATMEPDALPAMLVNIGNAQINLGDEDAAAASFREALKADPTYALAYRRLGNLEDWNEKRGDAASYYARACFYEPANPLNQSSAGTAYLRNDEPEKARDYLSESLRLLPEQPQVLYNLAVALLRCGEPEAAVDRLREAVQMDSRYTNAWQMKARIEVQIGRPAEAIESLRRALDGASDMSAEQAGNLRAFAQENNLPI